MSKAPATLFHLVKADYLERVRQGGFRLVLGLTAGAGYFMAPPPDAPYHALLVGGCRGVFNSPWLGTVFGLVAVTLLPLAGFFLVRDTLARDERTRVGRVLAATPVSRTVYLAGKTLGNLAVLSTILAVLNLMAFAMQAVRGEGHGLDPGALSAPIWGIAFPVLAIVAALAVLFEAVPFLRGAFGSVLYVSAWFAFLLCLVGESLDFTRTVTPENDLPGLSRSFSDLQRTLAAAGGKVGSGETDLFVPAGSQPVRRFLWQGVAWTGEVWGQRLGWCAIALGFLLAAVLPFARFDPARGPSGKKSRASPREARFWRPWRRLRARSPVVLDPEAGPDAPLAPTILSPLPPGAVRGCWTTALSGEIRFLFRSRKAWWYALAAGFGLTAWLAPFPTLTRYVYPATALLLLPLWSVASDRERRFRTAPVVFSSPFPALRQVPATWLAAVLATLLLEGGVGARFLAAGEGGRLAAWGVGACFVPALALALGTWHGGRRLFELIYLVWWIGSFERLEPLDFLGLSPAALARGFPIAYACLTLALLAAAVLGRQRQMSR